MRTCFHTSHGFTLIELMIVVAIIGILAAVAIPTFSYFIKHSKTSDGRDKLSMLAQGAIAYYNTEHFYSSDGNSKTAGLYPGCQNDFVAFQACSKSKTAIPTTGTKQDLSGISNSVPWNRLSFEPAGPVYYGFIYSSTNGTTFSACATANLSIQNDSQFTINGNSDGRLTAMIEHDDPKNVPDACK